MTPFRVGVIAAILVVVGTYFGFTRANPFANPYEFSAVFESAAETKPRSPVRIAGVNVGEVTKVEPIGNQGAARIYMKVKDEGLPIHRDAELKIRQRIFLEGNKFIDINPGSPSSPVLPKHGVIPANQTATPVQFSQLLAALQSDTRADLQTFLREYSRALDGGGADAFNRSIKYWEAAYKNSAIANEATLGLEERDLSRLIRGQGIAFGALVADEGALKGLITNLNITAAAFAREDDALEAAIPALRDVLRVGSPALRSLNDSLPSLRAFARDALPGVRSSGPVLDAGIPFITQARLLFSEAELKGLARDLRLTVPSLVRLQTSSVELFSQNRALSRCQNRIIVPFATDTSMEEPEFPENSNQPFYKQGPRGFVGLSSESAVSDAHSGMFHVQAGGGPHTILTGDPVGPSGPLISTGLFKPGGIRPEPPREGGRIVRPPYRPDVPCELQQQPNLKAGAGTAEGSRRLGAPKLSKEDQKELDKLSQLMALRKRGINAVDPLAFSDLGERLQGKALGFEQDKKTGLWHAVPESDKNKEAQEDGAEAPTENGTEVGPRDRSQNGPSNGPEGGLLDRLDDLPGRLRSNGSEGGLLDRLGDLPGRLRR